MARLQAQGDGHYGLEGALDHAAVALLWPQAQALVEQHRQVVVDLSAVGAADSAAVALLVYWLQQARRCQHRLQFVNIPPQMHGLIEVAGLSGLLPGDGGDDHIERSRIHDGR